MESTLKKFSNLKEPIFVLAATATFFFSAGFAFGGYLGLPHRVDTLEQDMAAVVCLVVAQQDGRSGDNCHFLMSERTREFLRGFQMDQFSRSTVEKYAKPEPGISFVSFVGIDH